MRDQLHHRRANLSRCDARRISTSESSEVRPARRVLDRTVDGRWEKTNGWPWNGYGCTGESSRVVLRNEIYGFRTSAPCLLATEEEAARRCLFDDSRIPRESQYEPVPLAETGILHGPVDVQADRVLPGPGAETGTLRIRADFHRVNRDLRRAGNTAESNGGESSSVPPR